jgi:release factor glutamine methyltransferase
VSGAQPVLERVRAAATQLESVGVPSPRYDAEELAAYVLKTSRPGLRNLAPLDLAAFHDFATAYAALIARRAAREPLQHLTGVAYFRHLALFVGPGVFVPRPETELLVELAAASCGLGRVVVDLCAGTGAIGLALATEHPGTAVHLVEADPAAAVWLRRNVVALAPAAQPAPEVHVVAVADALPHLTGVDLVVANPPYLPTLPTEELTPEVVDYDPPLALWGGPDGLDTLREVVAAAVRLLRPGGQLAVEHDARHQPEVVDLLQRNGFRDIAAHDDLTGRPRFVTGSRR